VRSCVMHRIAAALLIAILALLGGAGPGAAQTPDPHRALQWQLDHVGAPTAWSSTLGSDVVVAVIDTGVELDHPDLAGRLVGGVDLVDPGTSPVDENGHGTMVAGLIAATLDNGVGGVGVAPSSRVMPVRVLDAAGRGEPAHVAAGIRWAVANGAHVVNLSLTEQTEDADGAGGLITSEVEVAIRQARESGVLVIGAAGNEGQQRTPYRRGVPVVVVGASDADDAVWPDSNHDRRTLFAPGVGMVSTHLGGGYARADGTSFAAPLVAAGAALLIAADPDARPATVEQRLRNTAVNIGAGSGRIDLAAAVQRPAAAPFRAAGSAAPPLEVADPSPEPSPDSGADTPRPRPPIGAAPEGPDSPTRPASDPPADRPSPVPAADDELAAGPGEEAAAHRPLPAPDGATRPGWPVGVAAALLAAMVLGHVAQRRSTR
jgi:subtilisin family serine protease